MELIVSIALFLVLLLLIGVYVSKRVKDEEDWFIAGRNLGVVPLVGTYFATIISTVSVVGYMGYYYAHGWGGWWNWAGTALTSFISALWFARKLRNFGQVTLPDLFEARYGRAHSILAGVVILIAMIFFTCAQLVGCAAVITTTIPAISRTAAIVGIGAIFILFTVLGGMESVAWTDTFCSVVILLGVWALMYVIVGEAGGVVEIHRKLAEVKPTALDPFAGGAIPLGVAMSWFFTWGLGNIGSPQFSTRIYAAKDADTAAKSQAYCAVTFIFIYLPLMLIALAGIILVPGIESPDSVAPTLIKKFMNPWIGGLVMAGVLGAAISTADSVLLLAGTTFVRDILQKLSPREYSSGQLLKIARVTTFIIGIIAILATINMESGVMWIQAGMVGIMGSMLSIVVLAAFAWKRANSQGAMAAMLVGLATALVWEYLKRPFGWFPILPSLVTGLIALIVVSLNTPPPSEAVIDRFFGPEINA
ncbi:MAG: sodium:solute symporter family protein [Fretibacterium sp.]|nr:sodium:solute symporter family protein [Fretibacterium sp.]